MSSLLPPHASPLERALEAVAGARIEAVEVERLRALWTPADCPAPLLPWLAWALSVDEWDADWSEATQRAVIAASVEVHRRKGTLGAVRRALAATGYRTQISEWWQQLPVGVPHTFRIDVEIDDRGIDESTFGQLTRQLDGVKPVRSHYALRVFSTVRGQRHAAVAAFSGSRITLWPYRPSDVLATPSVRRIALALQSAHTATVYPR
ncbi:phage tail protein I [Plasticicumulans sp.]|uniref:phage tail protein I n=1 Tax=Plasticicumulans sp. TaxID=2307179 RepID=UPI002B960950|nr:phage tail protein I [Plasticicumulans sp.]HNM43794.1 phage tail protein I [Plasticicumulans sp.]